MKIHTTKHSRSGLRVLVSGLVVCLATGGVALGRGQIARSGTVIQVVTISKQNSSAILSRVLAVLAKETSVPVRWPGFIPTETGDEHPLYVNLISGDRDSYNLELGRSPDCIGGEYCHYGSVQASGQPVRIDQGSITVKLSGGVMGWFTAQSSCGPHCGDATVGWSEGHYQYWIGVKNGKKDDLVKMADSAIASKE